MTDIVERLRAWPTVEVASVLERRLMSEAADEIERLRNALTRYGLHTWDCAWNDSKGEKPCDCGWSALEKP
jgi:hypothetical protein